MSKKLSENEIKLKLQEGRNYKRLYFELKDKYDIVVAENKQLKLQIAELTTKFERIVEAQAARITELETMVFGRKPPHGGSSNSSNKKKPKAIRNRSSYSREIPSENEITSEEHFSINDCNHCGNALTDKQEHVRYEEDIPIRNCFSLFYRDDLRTKIS